MTPTSRNLLVIAASVTFTAMPAVAWLLIMGFSDDRLRWILAAGARISLVLFLLAYIARPLRQLHHSRFSAWLLANRRLVGVSFAAVHLVHLGFILQRFAVVPGSSGTPGELVPGAVVYVFIVALLVTSFDKPARAIGRKAWRFLHRTGIWVIFIAFAQTEIGHALAPEAKPVHYILAVLVVAALALRIAAFVYTRRKRRHAVSETG